MSGQKPVLGLDFGTTNTVAAWLDRDGKHHVVPVRDGSHTLPSVVCFHGKDAVLVGEPARQLAVDDPKHTLFGLKRFIGRRFLSDFVGRHRRRFVFHLVEGPDGMTAVQIYGEVRPLADVARHVVHRMAELAAIAAGEPFEEAVLAVPAHFSYRQRAVLREVVEQAGLKVRALINEPTAAAIYTARNTKEDRTMLVYDLGGGTFDTTLLRVENGVVEVLATGGEAFLGGADLDEMIADHFVSRFLVDHEIDLKTDMVVMQRLAFAAETAKIELSTEEHTFVTAPCITMKDDDYIDLAYPMGRDELEGICIPFIERTMGICMQVVGNAKLSSSDIDEVVLVGGQTKMPAIRERLSMMFHVSPEGAHDPDLSVALGAAMVGHGQQPMVDVLSIPIGILLPGTGPQEVIGQNTPLPTVKRAPIDVRTPLGQPLRISVYEAIEPTQIDRDIIGQLYVDPDWLAKSGADVTLEVRMGAGLGLAFIAHNKAGERLELKLLPPGAPPPQFGGAQAEGKGPAGDRVSRRDLRVQATTNVFVRPVGKTDLVQHVTENISQSGCFVRSELPEPAGTIVDVLLHTDGGPFGLRAEVVHAVGLEQAGHGSPAGMGLRFIQVSPEQTLKLTGHLESLQRKRDQADAVATNELEVGDAPEGLQSSSGEAKDPTATARRFFMGVRQDDLYRALGVEPLAPSSDIKQRIQELDILFTALMPTVKPEVARKLDTATHILGRMTKLMLDPRKRLEYDFRHGHIYADDRVALVGAGGADYPLLREAWRKVFPGDVDKAAIHVAYATRAAREQDYKGALRAGKEALELDPFDKELRLRLADWTSKA